MSKKRDWLKILSDSTMRLLKISDTLYYYSDGFYITGNEKIGNMLSNLAVELSAMSHEISGASGIVTTEILHSAQKNSWNVLQAALAGAGIKTAAEGRKISEEKKNPLQSQPRSDGSVPDKPSPPPAPKNLSKRTDK